MHVSMCFPGFSGRMQTLRMLSLLNMWWFTYVAKTGALKGWYPVQIPCHQVTKVAPLLTGQEEGPTISPAHLSWAWCSNPGHYLPFRGFQNFSCWQSRFLPKSYIRIMYYLKLLFILSPAFSRQNKAYSNYYQVFLGTPPNSPSLLLSVFVLNIKPIIRLDCIKIIEGMVKAMQYMISKDMFSIWPSDWW